MHDSAVHHPHVKTYFGIFVTLLVLLVVTVFAAEFDFGRVNFLVAVVIATTKAVLILLFFMHVRYSPRLILLFSFASFFWLAIMFVFTLSDYVTRGM